MTDSSAENRAHDVIVVGNGVLGMSLALALADRGVDVALVGEPSRPYAATAAAGAMLGCFGEVTESVLASEAGRAKHRLAVAARDRWDDWLDELGEDPRVADGTVVILNTVGLPGVDDVNFAAIRRSLIDHDEPFADIDPADIGWLDPDPGSRPLRALHIPGERAIDTACLLSALDAAVRRVGVTVVPERASALERSGDSATGVRLATGKRLAAPVVALAAGALTQDLLDGVPDLAIRVPRLVSGYGVSALIRTEDGTAPDVVVRTPNRAFACGLHVLPRGAGRVYAGATNIISPEPVRVPAVRDIVFLLECANRQVRRNLWTSGVEAVQVGNRPVPMDGFPLLGPTSVAGLWLMTGTYRDGLFLSPLLAREMSRAILGDTPEIDLSMFAPERKPIQAVSRAEVVDNAITHMLATGYEYDWSIPTEWPGIIERNLRESYERFAEALDPEYTPPPELLAASRLYPDLYKMLREQYAAARKQ